MRSRKSCIFGCDKLDAHIHRFPHPLNHCEWYKSWVAVMGDKLKDNDPMKVYNNKRVCDYHFKNEELTAGRRVVYGATPSLCLTSEPYNISIVIIFIATTFSKIYLQKKAGIF